MTNINKSLAFLWPSIRISLVLVLITSSILLFADLLGIVPNEMKFELENRKRLSESLAILFSTMAADQDYKELRTTLSKIVDRDEQILSAGFRMQSGKLLFEVGTHAQYWGNYHSTNSTTTHVLVPIFIDNKNIGSIELRFKELSDGGGLFYKAIYRLLLFVVIFSFFSFLFFILRTLRQIDPSSVIPDRVNAAFDTLSEGVVILDDKEQIVLANSAFSESVKRQPNSLLGFKLSELDWSVDSDEAVGEILYPWLIAMATGESSVGDKICLTVSPDEILTFVINCAPINDNKGNQQGILLTFDDVTELELQKEQLQTTVADLELSKKEVLRQNMELHILATRDPLTGSLNRRSFYARFDELFDTATKQGDCLCCIMVDIDHFKKVNDNYGHAVGDEVIKLLANILQSSTRDIDIVGRYGGEEFCVVLPGLDIDAAVSVAERIRLIIKDESARLFPSGPHVTASLGVSSILDHAKNPAELNEQADQALYIAKESGRNRVVSWSADTKSKSSHVENVNSDNNNVSNRISISDHSKQVDEIKCLQTQINQLENASASLAAQLQREQNYDKLTGLPNQALLYDRLTHAVERNIRHGRLTALLIVNVDLLSQAKSDFGKTIADEMIVSFSERLISVFRKTDSISLFNSNAEDLTISRINGDEFGILLSELDDQMVIPWIVKRLIEAMTQPILVADMEANVSCKVGISIFPEDASSSEELISHANTAMSYTKKDSKRNSYQFFDTEMQKASKKQLALEVELRRAVKNEEWLLYYQPKMDIATSKIKGVEALIRWNHPVKGVLSPFEFLDLAEEQGLIVEIGNWVIRTACKQAKIWADSGLDINVSVNLSAKQFSQENLSNSILNIIKETQVQPQLMEFEVTETILMTNFQTAVNTLNRLRCRGILISLDDFGTGYSSLSYLKQLPINTLKIDRMFIKDIATDDYDKNIVNSVISLAHGMNLKVIAEGVETLEQFNLLKTMSCDEIQGYLLSKPVDAESVTKLLEQKTACLEDDR
jgi:diguanylate cyclase (GGDEF)-like protein